MNGVGKACVALPSPSAFTLCLVRTGAASYSLFQCWLVWGRWLRAIWLMLALQVQGFSERCQVTCIPSRTFNLSLGLWSVGGLLRLNVTDYVGAGWV